MLKFYSLELHEHWMNKNFTPGRTKKIREIVLHHNAAHGVDPWATWQTREASAHFQVWGSGKIDYLVHVKDTAWHAHEANDYSIGIEHENSSVGGSWPIAEAGLRASAKLVGLLCYNYGLGNPKLGLNVTTHGVVESDGIGVDTKTVCPGPYFTRILNNQNHWYWTEANNAFNHAKKVHEEKKNPKPKPKPKPILTKNVKGMSARTLAKVMTIEGHTVTYSRLKNRLYFDKAYGGPAFHAKLWMAALNEALIQAKCITPIRVSMALAQLGAESGSFRYVQELADGWEYEGRTDLGNIHYGDGPRFKGRSYIQITGRANYTALSAWAFAHGYVPTKTYFIDHPAALAEIRYIFLGFVWYWTVARNMNYYADRQDIVGATRAVNGAENNLAGRTERWNYARKFGMKLLPFIPKKSSQNTSKPTKHIPVKSKPKNKPVKTVVVHRGQSLSQIAAEHHTTWQKLQRLNNLKNPNVIYVGQKLRVG